MININWNPTLQVYDVKIKFPDKHDFDTAITCIKLIPALSRSYDQDDKTWHISENFIEILKKAFTSQRLQFNFIEKPKVTPPFMQSQYLSEVDKYIITFFKLLPQDVAAKAFKFGMAALHPDRGGSTEDAAKLSEAWSFIEKNYFTTKT